MSACLLQWPDTGDSIQVLTFMVLQMRTNKNLQGLNYPPCPCFKSTYLVKTESKNSIDIILENFTKAISTINMIRDLLRNSSDQNYPDLSF